MNNFPIPRLDANPVLYESLLRYCRLRPGEIWDDPEGRHRVGCLSASDKSDVQALMRDEKGVLAIQDPPYNTAAFDRREVDNFIEWCRLWVGNTERALTDDSSLYVWLGADQNEGFQPLPDFMIMMRDSLFRSRSFITMRNQRGYGTPKNWMAVRQELLYYTKGKPAFDVDAEYTEIPKILRGYYKKVNGRVTENMERSKSTTIRAGNVWVDIQQVFYRMEENVNGCYAQKPLKSCDRIIRASSAPGELVLDFFCHSGSTLLASEMMERRCYTIAIRRLERFRETGKTGWQNGNPFEREMSEDAELMTLAGKNKTAEAIQQKPEDVQATLI